MLLTVFFQVNWVMWSHDHMQLLQNKWTSAICSVALAISFIPGMYPLCRYVPATVFYLDF